MKQIKPTFEELAELIAERLLNEIDEILAGGAQAHVALTGGSIGIASLAAVAASPITPSIDWNAVHMWWGDERYLPSGHTERNETQARQALLDTLAIPEANIHPIAGPETASATPEAAASAYATEIASTLEGELPSFNIVLLGMGPDGHIASLFPGNDALHNRSELVVAVHSSPKPPPTRISLSLPVLIAAENIWIVVAGAEKAEAVAQACGSAVKLDEIPATAVASLPQTTWFLDTAAASKLGV